MSRNFCKLSIIIDDINNITLVKFKNSKNKYSYTVISLTVLIVNFSYLLYYYTCLDYSVLIKRRLLTWVTIYL